VPSARTIMLLGLIAAAGLWSTHAIAQVSEPVGPCTPATARPSPVSNPNPNGQHTAEVQTNPPRVRHN
jgi:hypothetical protein